MYIYLFLLLLGALTASASNKYEISQLEEMQGLRFEEIGKLKLIKSNRAINFQINIQKFNESIQNATENFDLVNKMFQNDSYTQNKLNNLKLVLDLKKMEFEDTMHGLVKTEQDAHSRRKRGAFGFLDSTDAQNIKLDLEAQRIKTNEIIDLSNDLRTVYHNSSTLLNKTVEEIAKKTAMMYLMDEREDIERIVNALTKMFTERRLSSEIIPIIELEKVIKNITLNHDESLPYNRLIDYYFNLRLNYKVSKDVIEFGVDIPIVEKEPRKLYKIVEIPARNGDELVTTDVIWKYIAENENETVTFMSMDVCYESHYNQTMYYCKTQSPIKNKNATDCLNNALVGDKTIDMEICKYSAAKPRSPMFIKLNDGEYFYYTPINETIHFTCGAETNTEILTEKTSGIIVLEPQCIAVTSIYKLITTMRYEPITHNKIEIVRVSFDVDKLKENMKKYNTPFVNQFYMESLELLRDMSKPLNSVEKLDLEVASFNNFDFMSFLTILSSSIILIYVTYNAYMWKVSKQKKIEDTVPMQQDEIIEYYVVKE